MSEVRSRDDKPLPGIDYSEIHIPDEDNIGTGTFLTVLDPKAMTKINPIMSSIVNKPEFQLIMGINGAEEEATVLLGKADGNPAESRKVYKIPSETNRDNALQFKITFKEWDIMTLEMDGSTLVEVTG